jgi:Zn-dependent alcohol dehydrogenase
MASMTTRAAVLQQPGTEWEITELDLDPPKDYEVLIRYTAAGLCHSDEHIRAEGGSHIRFPVVGGREGAGIVEAVGPGVTRVWCSAVRAGETRAGETVVVMGVGGVGIKPCRARATRERPA